MPYDLILPKYRIQQSINLIKKRKRINDKDNRSTEKSMKRIIVVPDKENKNENILHSNKIKRID